MSRRYEHSDNREREISTTKGVLVGGGGFRFQDPFVWNTWVSVIDTRDSGKVRFEDQKFRKQRDRG